MIYWLVLDLAIQHEPVYHNQKRPLAQRGTGAFSKNLKGRSLKPGNRAVRHKIPGMIVTWFWFDKPDRADLHLGFHPVSSIIGIVV